MLPSIKLKAYSAISSLPLKNLKGKLHLRALNLSQLLLRPSLQPHCQHPVATPHPQSRWLKPRALRILLLWDLPCSIQRDSLNWPRSSQKLSLTKNSQWLNFKDVRFANLSLSNISKLHLDLLKNKARPEAAALNAPQWVVKERAMRERLAKEKEEKEEKERALREKRRREREEKRVKEQEEKVSHTSPINCICLTHLRNPSLSRLWWWWRRLRRPRKTSRFDIFLSYLVTTNKLLVD